MIILNSNDFKILACIVDKENDFGLCEARGTTKDMLKERSGLSMSTVNRSVKKLLQEELIAEGIKQIKKHSFYLTKKGKERMEDVFKNKSKDDGEE